MTSTTERAILEHEIERLKAEGYDVFLHPGPSLVPDFLGAYQPDAVAIRADNRIALEVASRTGDTPTMLGEVAAIFQKHPEWEFRVVWAEPEAGVPRLRVQTRSEIRAAMAEMEELRSQEHLRPAFLLGWAAFEAAARAIAEARFGQPQTPARLVQALGEEGYLTPDEADAMRGLAEKRNHLVHGTLDAPVRGADVDLLVRVLEAMTAEIAASS
jgi:uncharacterized protein YutE (UPF0331/DUF86 family)